MSQLAIAVNKPLIALTSYPRSDTDRFDMPARYIESVQRAGGDAVIVTPVSNSIESVIDHFDGFVLTGGADVCPSHYGGRQHEFIYGVNAERDNFELELARQLAHRAIPTMAICRGLQVLNVALGGTLVEHIPDDYGEAVIHRDKNFDKVIHKVSLLPDSKLANVMGCTAFDCASFHHQSIRDTAPQFTICGTAADGVIEAIESSLYPNIMGIQWHPEYTAEDDPLQQSLFNTFIEWSAAAKRRGV